MRGEAIGGAVPSAQNSGLRRFWILAREFLLFLREALNEPEDEAAKEATPLRQLLLEVSSTGR